MLPDIQIETLISQTPFVKILSQNDQKSYYIRSDLPVKTKHPQSYGTTITSKSANQQESPDKPEMPHS